MIVPFLLEDICENGSECCEQGERREEQPYDSDRGQRSRYILQLTQKTHQFVTLVHGEKVAYKLLDVLKWLFTLQKLSEILQSS